MMSMSPEKLLEMLLPLHTRIPEQEVMVFKAPMKGHEGQWLIIAVKLPEEEEDDDEAQEN